MEFLTASQVRQLQLTVDAAFEAAEIVDLAICQTLDAVLVSVTSPRAISAYRLTWQAMRYTVCLTMAAAYYSGVLTRELWNRFVVWADGYVESCQVQPVAPADELSPARSPLALPPARERRHNTVIAPWEERTLITPAPVVEIVPEQGKRRRGRPKKTA